MSEQKLGPPEHVGPLRVERYRKDDGRQLIVYSVEHGSDAESVHGPERGSDAAGTQEPSGG